MILGLCNSSKKHNACLAGSYPSGPTHLLMPWSGTASGWCSSTKRSTAAWSRAATASSSFWCTTVSSCCLADKSSCSKQEATPGNTLRPWCYCSQEPLGTG